MADDIVKLNLGGPEPEKPPTDTGSLQFDQAEPTQPATPGRMSCTACHTGLDQSYQSLNGQVLCAACRERFEREYMGGSGASRFLRAAFFGLLAGGLGCAIYYGITKLTGYEFSLVSILVGYMVGTAVK